MRRRGTESVYQEMSVALPKLAMPPPVLLVLLLLTVLLVSVTLP